MAVSTATRWGSGVRPRAWEAPLPPAPTDAQDVGARVRGYREGGEILLLSIFDVTHCECLSIGIL